MTGEHSNKIEVSPTDPVTKEWRCFHCDEVFTDSAEAALHFGETIYAEPFCQAITAEELRDLQHELARYREEDTDLHREIQRMQADHITALRREEEKGYGRAIRDLSSAIQKLAPDLAEEIGARWTRAKAEENAALAEILAVLRGPEDAIHDAR